MSSEPGGSGLAERLRPSTAGESTRFCLFPSQIWRMSKTRGISKPIYYDIWVREHIMDQTRFETEVDRNYAVFETALGNWLAGHRGQFALMRHGELVAFHPTQADALASGRAAFADRLFSVQEVTDRPVDLGFFSHAVDPRVA
jgi:hypothetical protein